MKTSRNRCNRCGRVVEAEAERARLTTFSLCSTCEGELLGWIDAQPGVDGGQDGRPSGASEGA